MVIIPPYLASSEWYANWLQSLIATSDPGASIKEANCKAVSPREFGRTKIRETNGKELMLSVAVEGGGRQLRRLENVEKLLLSDHGDWKRVHLSAIEAAYGKYPFYLHVSDILSDIFNDTPPGSGLGKLNLRIHEEFANLLLGNFDKNDIKLLKEKEIIKLRGKEIGEGITPGISILEPLMKYGPEALIGIIGLSN